MGTLGQGELGGYLQRHSLEAERAEVTIEMQLLHLHKKDFPAALSEVWGFGTVRRCRPQDRLAQTLRLGSVG